MLSDDRIRAICQSELSENSDSGDLQEQREKAIDYYYGEMDDYLVKNEDRSDITTRDVMDTIESVLPSLIKVFVEEENCVMFKPFSARDEEQAKIETQAVRSVFFDENNGFLNLYTYLKDALLSKNAIFKVYPEDNEWEREEYEGLDQIEVQKILNDESIEYQVEEVEVNEEGTVDLVCLTRKKQTSIKVEVVTPEEFGISSDAPSINVKEARFCWQTTEKTISDLVAAGYDRDILNEIPIDEGAIGQERIARRHLSNEQDTSHEDRSMQSVWVTECYPLIDRNEDGIAERLKVVLVGGEQGDYSSLTLLDIEESRVPFSSGTPVLLTHKFYGYSLADLVMDIQEARTVFFRNIYDNTYLANNMPIAANENVNVDDLLEIGPGKIVRTVGESDPRTNLGAIQHTPLMPESFGLLEVFDEMLKNRTGVGDEVAGLDSNALANINTGVIMQAYDNARMRIMLMARILGETGLKPCFEDIHRELHLNQSTSIQFKIGSQWVDTDPRIWSKNRKSSVKIGIGNADKIKRKAGLSEVLQLQEKAAATGYMTPQHAYNTVSDMLELDGMDVQRYFPDPQNFEPPQPPPNPMVQIEQAKLQLEQQKLQHDAAKMQGEMQLKVAIEQSKDRQMQMKAEIEGVKNQYQLQKMAIDEQSQVMNAQTANMEASVNNEVKMRDIELKERIASLEAVIEQQKLAQASQEAQLKAATTLEVKEMDITQKANSDLLKHIQSLATMMQTAEQQREEQKRQVLEYVNQNGSEKMKAFAGRLQ